MRPVVRPVVRPARNHALTIAAAGTLVVEMATLHLAGRVFTGGWLGDHVLTGLGERLGLAGLLALTSLGFCGILLGTLVPLLRLIRVPPERGVWIVALGWLLVLIVVAGARMKIGTYVQDALDFDLVRRLGGGTILGAIQYVLTWFWLDILLSLAGIVAAIVLCRFVYRRLRRTDFSRTALGRVPRMPVRLVIVAGILVALLDATALGGRWPAVSWAAGRTFVGGLVRTAVATATDLDGDGSGAFDAPPDLAPFDASRHPFAADRPDDGIDSNGLLGDLRRADLPARLLESADARSHRPGFRVTLPRNVVLVFLESFRHDLLGRVENDRAVTPVLDGLIASGEALRVDAAWACIGFTAPAVTQSFWGRYVRRESTLFHDLHDDNGYFCGTASGQAENWSCIDVDTELTRSDFYEDSNDDPDHSKGGIRTVDRVLASIDRFLAARPADRPFFLYVNLQDCHFPYSSPDDPRIHEDLPEWPGLSRDNAAVLWKHYVNQAAAVDQGIGAIRERLQRASAWEDTILVLISDHGESIFHDDVLGHGLRLTDNQTHLACVIVHPTTDVVAPLSHVDLRGMIHGMLTAERPTERPVVRLDPGLRVLQVIGSLERPRRIAHVDPTNGRVLYDLERGLCIDERTGRTCRLDSDRAGDAELERRARDLIRHWEYERWRMQASSESLSAPPPR